MPMAINARRIWANDGEDDDMVEIGSLVRGGSSMLKGRVLGLPRLFSTSAEDRFDVMTVQGGELRADNMSRSLCLVETGEKVLSINRSGTPRQSLDWMKNVKYLAADVFSPETWRSMLVGAQGVVAAIGGFGSYEAMKRINGEANIVAEAAAAGVHRMVFVSATFPPFPASIPLRGYIEGKESVEKLVKERFPSSFTILKPSVIYGNQPGAHPLIATVRAFGPLQEPLMSQTPLHKFSGLPVIGSAFVPWSPVEAVGRAAAEAAISEVSPAVMSPSDIARYK
ncbi:hypothetical protein GUITHDRAFT_104952 [Guillardia theta CCMP2712]|uniref:NAD(P)-binding domain-containing protein n=1 Tax=Guillardia theta (strain CCMP2712) TaxID=905079 RepID=L1JMX0_GUITC|nr:hypothetical protein GUITHDRAFT_104952 [Guillardia theta CCMP2712]EKX49423.1 hypothetical protein GUITHDRAFT_104952 [Guillardia theta CCMP2712]|eukprot:XP_005836403.1 hypothetical protein GUITHDRAFT_104952 [Guillardia theta CCMP2712]